jgi:hypothetical protein
MNEEIKTIGEEVRETVSHLPTSSPNLNEIATALSKAQTILTHPVKKNKAGSGSFSYTYADLPAVIDVVKDAFTKNGLSFTQFPSVSVADRSVALTTLVMHTSGQFISSSLSMGLVDLKPQTVGSAITYARRYALSAMAGIAAETDDDGSTASGKTGVKFQRRV